ncbi:MAG: pilus assembly protein N-terminal domain-containing protein, partial [Planctomycetes bacterium]|nr:pilus assembly protein N-terminal domain-containing protein [Planctomycetota bacterium]
PNPEVLKEFSQFVQGTVDATNTLDLVVGRPRLLVLKEPPKRVQTDSEERNAILSFNLVTDREISLVGRRVGTAVLNLWFPDPKDPTKERILSYLVRVLPDFQAAEQARQWQERYYKALEKEINCAFPDSAICLRLAGNNLIVSGEAHDIEEAAHIIQVVTTNAPRSFLPTAPIAPGQVTQTSATTDVSLTGSQTTQTTVTTPTTEPGAETGLAEARTQVGQAGQQGRTGTQGYNIVNLIHVPGEQQVSLKVTVAEVNRQAARTIGINFNILNNKGQVVFANNTGEIGGGGVPGGMNNGNSGMGANLPVSLDNGKINLAIQALRNLNFARTLAEPNLVTMNGKTARFQAGGQFPVPIVTGFTAAGLQGVSFVPFGVQLNFTPTITDKDRIRLSVGAEVSTRDAANSATIGNTSVPSLNNRTFQTTVELREGQTLAVAGLIQNNFGANATRVPLFGDLPVIGRLFAFDGTSAAEQELVILVTPELVHPVEHEKPALPGSDLFEPGDVEFYLLGRLESRRSYDYRSPVRTDINRMARYQHCEDIFITGPKGHSDGH